MKTITTFAALVRADPQTSRLCTYRRAVDAECRARATTFGWYAFALRGEKPYDAMDKRRLITGQGERRRKTNPVSAEILLAGNDANAGTGRRGPVRRRVRRFLVGPDSLYGTTGYRREKFAALLEAHKADPRRSSRVKLQTALGGGTEVTADDQYDCHLD